MEIFKCGIYKWTNKITGEYYIGQSKNLKKRYLRFLDFSSQYAGPVIDKVRKQYPSLSYWIYDVLLTCDSKDLNKKEKEMIEEHQSELLLNEQYNIDYNYPKLNKKFKELLKIKYPYYKKIFNDRRVHSIILDKITLSIPYDVTKDFSLKDVIVDHYEYNNLSWMEVDFNITYEELINFIKNK